MMLWLMFMLLGGLDWEQAVDEPRNNRFRDSERPWHR